MPAMTLARALQLAADQGATDCTTLADCWRAGAITADEQGVGNWTVKLRLADDTPSFGDWQVGVARVTRYARGDEYAEVAYYVETADAYGGDPDRFVTTCRVEGPATNPDTADISYDSGSAFYYDTLEAAQRWVDHAGQRDESYAFAPFRAAA